MHSAGIGTNVDFSKQESGPSLELSSPGSTIYTMALHIVYRALDLLNRDLCVRHMYVLCPYCVCAGCVGTPVSRFACVFL